MGNTLIKSKNPQSEEVQVLLRAINDCWGDLTSRAADRGKKLQQAVEEQELIHGLEDAAANIQEMEVAMASQDVGHDLRSVKSLLKKQQVVFLCVSVKSDM